LGARRGEAMSSKAFCPIALLALSSLTLSITMFSAASYAHHGTGIEYDADHPLTLKGTVTEFVWANPHVQIYFDVKDAKGNVVHWASETLSPGKLVRGGWTRDCIKPGEVITVNLDPSRKGAPVGFLRNVVLPGGKILKANPLGPPPPPQQ
jgi:hypothetical protein